MTTTNEEDEDYSEALPTRRRESHGDKFHLVYLIFFFCGIATLLPWNFFITAVSFFKFKLRNESLPAANYSDPETQTEMQLIYENYLVIIASTANFLFMLLNLLITKRVNRNRRFVLGSAILVLVFAGTITLAEINMSSYQVVFFWLAISLGSLASGGSAFTQGSVIGLAGIFPTKYTKAVMEGQALGGIIAAIANVITLYLASDPVKSGLLYFIIAEVFILTSIILFMILPKFKYVKACIEAVEGVNNSTSVINANDEEDIRNNSAEYPLLNDTITIDEEASILDTVWKVKIDALGLMTTFFITLSIFPAVLAKIEPMKPDGGDPWKSTFFTPVLCFVLFNIGDYAGRFLIGLLGVLGRRLYWLHNVLIVSRVVFFPLILMCNVQPRHNHGLPVLLRSDAFPGVFTLLLGISNGYLVTSSIILAVSSVRPNCMELAGNVMSLFLVAGITVGGVFSLLLVTLV